VDSQIVARVRGVAGGPILRALVRTPFVRTRLARRRSQPVEGEVVDEELAAVLRLDDLLGQSEHRGLTPAQARLQIGELIRLCEAPVPEGVTAHDEHVPGPAGPIPVRCYAPAGLPSPSPGMVFFHGGGWVTGDLVTHDHLCRRIAGEARLRVIAVDYRLAPEHPFPAGVEDAVAAFGFVARRAERFGIDAARLGVAGDSAGGNLAAVVARRTRGDAVTPAVVALVYPGLDLTRSSASHRTFGERYFLTSQMIEWYLDHYLGTDRASQRHIDASPLLAEDHGGMLGIHLITVAHFDPLRDEGEAYARKLASAGARVKLVRLPTMIHGFAVIGGASPAALAATETLIGDIGAALRGELSG